MNNKAFATLLLFCSPLLAHAHSITLGQALPSVSIASAGELILTSQKNIIYQDWSSQNLVGKVRVIQAIAGRSHAKEMNEPLMTAITKAEFPAQQYQTTTIVNQDDAIWGTGSFVKSSVQESKQDFPWSSIVLDETGKAAKTWQLKNESSAIIVQDKEGKVLFIKEGSLSPSEIQNVLTLIRQNLPSS